MFNFKTSVTFLILTLLFSNTQVYSQGLADNLREISVTIKCESGFSSSEGSGVIITRVVDGKKVNFVWTAAHVISSLRVQKTKIIAGKPLTVIEFKPVNIVKELYQDDELVGEVKMRAEVVKYSDAEEGHDLALLRVLKSNFVNASAKFYLNPKTPSQGTELYHMGSLLGQFGSNSLTDGIISSVGRKLRGLKGVFDQTTVTAQPGSSGGGVFLKSDGSYVGMLVRGVRGSDGFNFIVPVRRMLGWAKRSNILWALDPRIKMPSLQAIKSLPVENFQKISPRKRSFGSPYFFLIHKESKVVLR